MKSNSIYLKVLYVYCIFIKDVETISNLGGITLLKGAFFRLLELKRERVVASPGHLLKIKKGTFLLVAKLGGGGGMCLLVPTSLILFMLKPKDSIGECRVHQTANVVLLSLPILMMFIYEICPPASSGPCATVLTYVRVHNFFYFFNSCLI